ncbi:acyl-CoA reductase [Streptomyces sp. NBC_00091]|uniref:acyl-CoA reductase n=1 Tax=Streptomyces sp. NBC_00091 TaxID=2975648 RepID=UPI00225B0540|nr:acyl-CoA reductase [Streptomyces sp. NBC_00091]MCX5381596.1 long-chain-fatty-acyl-CoA reductase [Streptomyces sp. NBC_00091]
MSDPYDAPAAAAVLRGRTVTGPPVRFAARDGLGGFLSPDPHALLPRLPLRDPHSMAALGSLRYQEIEDYLAELGPLLDPGRNALIAQAVERSAAWSDLTAPLLRTTYAHLPALFTREAVRAVAEHTVGLAALDGWRRVPQPDGRSAAVRAVGSRTVHVIAGNSPLIAALTVIRNALTRGDAIVKTPSNDPLTAPAIARTAAAMAPGHPLTAHLSVLHWKGGDTAFEEHLYHPAHVEKIVAWGGFASVRHVTRYLRPGLELIALDPKLSVSLIGPEGFATEQAMALTARHAAADVAALNQLGCMNSRVVHAVTGTDRAGVARAEAWSELLHHEIQRLPEAISTPARRFDPELRGRLQALRTVPDWYRVFGGRQDEGAVVVSLTGEAVDFTDRLSGRVVNVVPTDDAHTAVRGLTSATQTLGVYPDTLRLALRDIAPLYGVQRIVALGYATHYRPELPQDAMEPLRRMIRWITDESADPALISPAECLGPLPATARPCPTAQPRATAPTGTPR